MRAVKRLMMISISFLLTIGVLSITEVNGASAIKDIRPTHWAYKDFENLLNKGYLGLYKDGTVRPNQNATRAETAAVIARSLGMPSKLTTKVAAVDIENHQYKKELTYLIQLGIMNNQQYVKPEEPVNRAQIAKMLALAYQVKVDNTNQSSFRDIGKMHWARQYILSLADLNVIVGKQGNLYDPNSSVTRAQLAALVNRLLSFQQKIDNNELAYDFRTKHYVTTSNDFPKWDQILIEEINKERKKTGAPLLLPDPKLSQLSRIKAQDMVAFNYFDHNSKRYGQPWDLAYVFNYEFLALGENLARNGNSPKEFVAAWMKSPDHKNNMLNSNYQYIGIGVKKTKDNKYYVVTQFSKK